MITATRTPPSTTHSCDRCGIELARGCRKSTYCRDCYYTFRKPKRSAVNRARQVAREQGWDYDNPAAGPWGARG